MGHYDEQREEWDAKARAERYGKVRKMTKRMGYRETLDWLLDNDDVSYFDDEEIGPTTVSALAADMFGKTDEELRADLVRRRDKRASNAAQ